jgi:hypothetical protein
MFYRKNISKVITLVPSRRFRRRRQEVGPQPRGRLPRVAGQPDAVAHRTPREGHQQGKAAAHPHHEAGNGLFTHNTNFRQNCVGRHEFGVEQRKFEELQFLSPDGNLMFRVNSSYGRGRFLILSPGANFDTQR